jgi:hypothetical protein
MRSRSVLGEAAWGGHTSGTCGRSGFCSVMASIGMTGPASSSRIGARLLARAGEQAGVTDAMKTLRHRKRRMNSGTIEAVILPPEVTPSSPSKTRPLGNQPPQLVRLLPAGAVAGGTWLSAFGITSGAEMASEQQSLGSPSQMSTTAWFFPCL